ncbi:MAG: hypothetical protein M3R51_03565 [Candidatus Eremiobacteraeota bacterium]|nr:hypothetical protein [Candidatus Eremiobacteraeota bacterium]
MDANDIGKAVAQPQIISGPGPRPIGRPIQIPPGENFRAVLGGISAAAVPIAEPLRFSAHAMARLESRNISLSSEDVTKMNVMADKAAAKGAKNALFIMRDVAMVVSIKNRTVITAVDSDSMKENVFTNIDSAALI